MSAGRPARCEVPVLETEMLRLRGFGLGDFDAYATMLADPEVGRFLGGPSTRQDAWRHLAYSVGHWQLRGYGMWAVEERATGALVGRIGLAAPEGWPGVELGWTLAREYWGYGYATEGARAALEYAFTELALEHLISLIDPRNAASIRVAERLGEAPEGMVELFGTELIVYGIHREASTDGNGIG